MERLPFRDEKLRRFCLRSFRLFHCSKIEIKKRIVFVAIIFILLAQTEDFLEDLHIEPFPFCLREDFFFPLVKRLDLLIDMSMRSIIDKMRLPATPTVSVMSYLSLVLRHGMAAKVTDRLTDRLTDQAAALTVARQSHAGQTLSAISRDGADACDEGRRWPPGDQLENATKGNVRLGVIALKTATPLLSAAANDKRITIVDGIYRLDLRWR